MCGIAGWYRRGSRSVGREHIARQCDMIRHRGPDDEGLFVDGDFGFGMRRLSILDVAGGHQPMHSPDNRLALVMNGEIYNHLDLRGELEDVGYRFATRSDTETVLAGFAVWGNRIWAKLEGMFAVAVWDRSERMLTLARDPLGIKPLYMSERKGGLSFASELKALRGLPEHSFTVDPAAIRGYLEHGGIREGRSIYREVKSLPPGHFLRLAPTGEAESRRYWQPRYRRVEGLTSEQWQEDARAILSTSVERHLQADVEVGVFLSGGIDSSIIATCMAEHGGAKAFTISFPESKIDEAPAARAVARNLGFDHIVLDLDVSDACRIMEKMPGCFDEPFADIGAIPNFALAELASRHVKVVLCGEGGDELFAGYKRHRNANLIERWRLGATLLAPLAHAMARLPRTGSTRTNYLLQHASRFLELRRAVDGFDHFERATLTASRSLLDGIFGSALIPDQSTGTASDRPASSALWSVDARSMLEEFLHADLTINMPAAQLVRLDRTTMAHSLEARVPFLSHKVVDWALSVPMSEKIGWGKGKQILRRAFRDHLPPEIVNGAKRGFQFPFAAWFRGRLGDLAYTAWNDGGLKRENYLNAAAVDTLFHNHRAGLADHGRLLFVIGSLALWWEHAAGDATAADAPSIAVQAKAAALPADPQHTRCAKRENSEQRRRRC